MGKVTKEHTAVVDMIDTLENIQEEINAVQAELSKAEGRYEAAMQAINEAGFNTIEEAESHIGINEKKLQARVERLEKEYNAFMAEYHEVFDA